MEIEALKATFFLECEELLSASEENLDSLRSGADPDAAVNALFRNVHSIKGGAGAFELDALAGFAHAFESFMSRVRKGDEALTDEVLRLLFDSVDALTLLVEAARDDLAAPSAQIDQTLRILREKSGLDDRVEELDFEFTPVPVFEAETAAGGTRRYRIHFAPGPRMMEAGVDPLLVIRTFKSLGQAEISCDASALPSLEDLDSAICHWRWTIRLETDQSPEALAEIVEMVDDLAVITIEAEEVPDAATALAVFETQSLPDPVPSAASPPPTSAQAMPKTAEPRTLNAQSAAPKTVRVEVSKLERLGNMVGELVITQAFLMRQAARLSFEDHPDLFRALEEMSQHIRDLQDSSLALRAQPLKSVFSRFGHLLRDLEKTTGKKIVLTTVGEDTEIDKTVVERLAEPLTHLIRNAVDHGIESAEDRIAAGKPAEGRIRLSAEQRGSQVIIELTDDGGGINRDRVRAKAIERDLIAADAVLTDEEIDDLIFLAGFSTKETVTELSGRGVGMDAVRQTIVDMGGRVFVRSQPGQGSRFVLTLPLSLAVLDAMITVVGRQRFLIPVHNVQRSLRPEPQQIMALDRGDAMLSVQNEMLRIIPIGREFKVPDAVTDPCRGLLIIVEGTMDNQRAALLVDDLLGQEPVVVKSLERNYRKVPGIAAATILGDGRAALILDLLTLGQPPARRVKELA